MKPQFLYAIAQAKMLKGIRNKEKRHWMERNILKVLLSGLSNGQGAK